MIKYNKKDIAEIKKSAEHEILNIISLLEVASRQSCVKINLVKTKPVVLLGKEVVINVEIVLSDD